MIDGASEVEQVGMRARIDESMEALIHHFKIFTEGFKVPEGEVYVGIDDHRPAAEQ